MTDSYTAVPEVEVSNNLAQFSSSDSSAPFDGSWIQRCTPVYPSVIWVQKCVACGVTGSDLTQHHCWAAPAPPYVPPYTPPYRPPFAPQQPYTIKVNAPPVPDVDPDVCEHPLSRQVFSGSETRCRDCGSGLDSN